MEELLNRVDKLNITLEESLRISNENTAYIAAETANIKHKFVNMSNATKTAFEKLIKNSTQSLAISKESSNKANNTLNILKSIKTNSEKTAKIENANTKVINKMLSNSFNLQNNIRTSIAYPLKTLNSVIYSLSKSITTTFKSLKNALTKTASTTFAIVKTSFNKLRSAVNNVSFSVNGIVSLIGKIMMSTIKFGANLLLAPIKIGLSVLTNFFTKTLVGKLTSFGLLAFGLYKFVTGTKLGSALYNAFKNSEFGKSVINFVKTASAITIGIKLLPTVLSSIFNMLTNYLTMRKFSDMSDNRTIGRKSVTRNIGKSIGRNASTIGKSALNAGKSFVTSGKVLKLAKGAGIGAVASIAGDIAIDKAVEKGMIDKSTGNVGSKALTGAALGATIGSIIPGVGTAVGAAIGGIGGAAVGFIQNQIDKRKTELSKLDNMQNKAQVANNPSISTVHNVNAASQNEQIQIAKVSSRDAINTKLSLSTAEYEKAQHADAVKQQAELEKANKLNKELVDTMKDLSMQMTRNNYNFNSNKKANISSVAG